MMTPKAFILALLMIGNEAVAQRPILKADMFLDMNFGLAEGSVISNSHLATVTHAVASGGPWRWLRSSGATNVNPSAAYVTNQVYALPFDVSVGGTIYSGISTQALAYNHASANTNTPDTAQWIFGSGISDISFGGMVYVGQDFSTNWGTSYVDFIAIANGGAHWGGIDLKTGGTNFGGNGFFAHTAGANQSGPLIRITNGVYYCTGVYSNASASCTIRIYDPSLNLIGESVTSDTTGTALMNQFFFVQYVHDIGQGVSIFSSVIVNTNGLFPLLPTTNYSTLLTGGTVLRNAVLQ